MIDSKKGVDYLPSLSEETIRLEIAKLVLNTRHQLTTDECLEVMKDLEEFILNKENSSRSKEL